MKKSYVLHVLAAILLIPSAFAQNTLTLQNSTSTVTSASVNETSPTQGLIQLYTLNPSQSINTKIPADGNTIVNLKMQQNNADVANTPLLLVNVKLANLVSQCNAAIPPCLNLTPSVVNPGVSEANDFLAERSKTKEFCLPGELSVRNGARYFALANGLIVRLMGKLDKVPESGRSCLCGVMGTPPEPLDTIAFDVHKACDTPAHERKEKE